MRTKEFTLKSGKKLTVTEASFEIAISLIEAIKQSTIGMPAGAELSQAVFAFPSIRQALIPAFNSVLWGVHKVSPALFDDPKVGGEASLDYFEIVSRVIEVNYSRFFLTNSLPSTTTQASESKNQE